ncbi:MAG: hypothetical protein QOJ96_1695 [Alphaproteobacteria bacterium]|jgi:hypothetical protein|nr:hypothetical protein [Alphaproteobacteria bacterium]
MSSPKAATRPKTGPLQGASLSAQALTFAAELEQRLADDRLDVSREAIQNLMAAICKIYSRQAQNGDPGPLLQPGSGVSPTDVMITASELLRSADLQVFDLGMWQSFTGR